FYRLRRIGAGGRPFDCIKFRSMAMASDAVPWRGPHGTAALDWTVFGKPLRNSRITPIGRFLRASGLDELPQLLNVVRGEMSIVGPKPIVQVEIALYGSEIEHYYAVKPGLTGLWRISGAGKACRAQRVQLDVWYARNWSLWHDTAILLKTLPAVFLQHGAR